jgi:hypothetical protein
MVVQKVEEERENSTSDQPNRKKMGSSFCKTANSEL